MHSTIYNLTRHRVRKDRSAVPHDAEKEGDTEEEGEEGEEDEEEEEDDEEETDEDDANDEDQAAMDEDADGSSHHSREAASNEDESDGEVAAQGATSVPTKAARDRRDSAAAVRTVTPPAAEHDAESRKRKGSDAAAGLPAKKRKGAGTAATQDNTAADSAPKTPTKGRVEQGADSGDVPIPGAGSAKKKNSTKSTPKPACHC